MTWAVPPEPRDQLVLFPSKLDEVVPQEHLVRDSLEDALEAIVVQKRGSHPGERGVSDITTHTRPAIA